MLAFLLRRLGQSLLVVVVMASLVFVGVYAIGNPIDILISPEADQLEREQAIARLGLDKPFWMQFWLFLIHALSGDLGKSFVHGVPAAELIFSRMPATLELAGRRARPFHRTRHSARAARPASRRSPSSAARS